MIAEVTFASLRGSTDTLSPVWWFDSPCILCCTHSLLFLTSPWNLQLPDCAHDDPCVLLQEGQRVAVKKEHVCEIKYHDAHDDSD